LPPPHIPPEEWLLINGYIYSHLLALIGG